MNKLPLDDNPESSMLRIRCKDLRVRRILTKKKLVVVAVFLVSTITLKKIKFSKL